MGLLAPGSCVALDFGFSCTCAAGFSGFECASAAGTVVTDPSGVVPCEYGACHNGGSCIAEPQFGYTCNCTAGYSGHNCEEGSPPAGVTECPLGACYNGASCNLDSADDTSWCYCEAGYIGADCSKTDTTPPPDDCDTPDFADLCKNNGTSRVPSRLRVCRIGFGARFFSDGNKCTSRCTTYSIFLIRLPHGRMSGGYQLAQ